MQSVAVIGGPLAGFLRLYRIVSPVLIIQKWDQGPESLEPGGTGVFITAKSPLFPPETNNDVNR